MKKIAFLLLLLSFCSHVYGFEWDSSYNVAVSSCSKSDIIRVLKYAVHINEVFKSCTVYDENYKKIRELLELYHDVILAPSYRGCVQILSKNKDHELATEMIKLLISYENSADEELSFGFATIYAKNPNSIETAIGKLDIDKQKELINRLGESLRLLEWDEEKIDISVVKKRLATFTKTVEEKE